ncbi:MAG: hypothetical protein K2X03_08660 [Bryobacteraceae bacterium]|nr:hypothetical protein [Bryobacteraceae bacterium]
MQPSRRKFAALLATPLPLLAQTPPPEDLAALAKGQMQSTSDRLRQFKLDISVEPAFAFKP